jgi:hypothetical protein
MPRVVEERGGEPVSQTAAPLPQQRHGLRPRLVSGLCLLVLLALSVAATLATRALVGGQERRLLTERTQEVGLVLTEAVSSLQSSLSDFADGWRAGGGTPAAFLDNARLYLQSQPAANRPTLAAVRPSGSGFTVVAAAGPYLSPGELLPAMAAPSLHLALSRPGLVATPVVRVGGVRYLGFALGPPVAPNGLAALQWAPLNAPTSTRPARSTAPFAELAVALYATPQARRSQLLLLNTTRSLAAPIGHEELPVGNSRWLLQVSARHPLVGSIAGNAPWYVLGALILLSLLVTAVVEAVLRRRDAALALYAAEHRVSESLQRSLLPELPVVDGLDLAARYLPSGPGQQVGGDWFDVFPVAGNRVGFAVGDVLGHDIEAAAAMSQVRAALRSYAHTGADPATVLDLVEQAVDTFNLAPLVTVVYGLLDPPGEDGSRRLLFANAGHLSPLLRTPDGRVHALEGGSSIVIGAQPGSDHTQAEEELTPGATLLLFTDGLVEVPGGSLDEAVEQLARTIAAAERGSGAADVCDRIVRTTNPEQLRDDVALLAIRVLPSETPAHPDPTRDAEPAAAGPQDSSSR